MSEITRDKSVSTRTAFTSDFVGKISADTLSIKVGRVGLANAYVSYNLYRPCLAVASGTNSFVVRGYSLHLRLVSNT